MWKFRCSNGARWPNLGSWKVRWFPEDRLDPTAIRRPVLERCSGRAASGMLLPVHDGTRGPGFESCEVELLARDSNRQEWLAPLADVLRRDADGDNTDIPGCITLPEPRQRPPQTRQLSAEQVEAILGQYQAGTGQRELAKTYGVTERAIKWLLQKHGVERKRKRGAA